MLKQLLEKQILHKISKGVSVESDLEKMNFFCLRGQLTEQEYDELFALIPHHEPTPDESTEVEIPQAPEIEIEEPETEIEESEEPVVVEGVEGTPIEEEQPVENEVIIVIPEESTEIEEETVEE